MHYVQLQMLCTFFDKGQSINEAIAFQGILKGSVDTPKVVLEVAKLGQLVEKICPLITKFKIFFAKRIHELMKKIIIVG